MNKTYLLVCFSLIFLVVQKIQAQTVIDTEKKQEQEQTINLEIHLQQGYFLDTLVDATDVETGDVMWFAIYYALYNSSYNKITEGMYWSNGRKKKISIDSIQVSPFYYFKYNICGDTLTTTIQLVDIQKGPIVINFREAESKRLNKDNTLIDQLNDLGKLSIQLSAYPIGRSKIVVIKEKNIYQAKFYKIYMGQETLVATNSFLTTKQQDMLRAFELDSRRSVRNTCHDINQHYTFSINNKKKRTFHNDCGIWTGYFVLKKGLFGITSIR